MPVLKLLRDGKCEFRFGGAVDAYDNYAWKGIEVGVPQVVPGLNRGDEPC